MEACFPRKALAMSMEASLPYSVSTAWNTKMFPRSVQVQNAGNFGALHKASASDFKKVVLIRTPPGPLNRPS